jgi:hypothetical protein
MKPGIMLGTMEDFRLCRLLSWWLTGKGRDLEYSNLEAEERLMIPMPSGRRYTSIDPLHI